MPPANTTIAFTAVPKSIAIAGQNLRPRFSAVELEETREKAFQEGVEETTRAYDAQVAQLKEDVTNIVHHTLVSVVEKHAQALEQMRSLVPQLVAEATARIVAGIQWDETLVRSVVNELLGEVAPGAENVEVQLNPEDIRRVEGFETELRQKFPSLTLKPNKELKEGDCMVRTRFGVLDGRIVTKVKALEGLLS